MSDEKDRLGDKLHDVDAAREDQWAKQRDEEILAKLRHKYVKAIACPQCGQKLEARVAIGVGGMACPDRHGAWADRETLDQLETRLQKAAAVRHESVGEQVFDYRRRTESQTSQRDRLPRLQLTARSARCDHSGLGWIGRDVLSERSRRVDRSGHAGGNSQSP